MRGVWRLIGFAVVSSMLIGSCSSDKTTGPAKPKAPTVTTTAVSEITTTTATSGGSITSDGGADITARGVCWSTSSAPAITDDKTTDGTGTGSFTSSLTGLTDGTNYYVRAYATNSAGTGYGSAESFFTPVIPHATVHSSFDADADDWSVSGGGIYYHGIEGNPGGFIEFEDTEDGNGSFSAPNKFLGNLSIYSQGTLGFDLKNTIDNGQPMLGGYGLVRISSGTLTAEKNVVPYNTYYSDWISFSIPLTADTWGVTSTRWDSILTNVTDIDIFIDAQWNYYDRIGLDNFSLIAPAE